MKAANARAAEGTRFAGPKFLISTVARTITVVVVHKFNWDGAVGRRTLEKHFPARCPIASAVVWTGAGVTIPNVLVITGARTIAPAIVLVFFWDGTTRSTDVLRKVQVEFLFWAAAY